MVEKCPNCGSTCLSPTDWKTSDGEDGFVCENCGYKPCEYDGSECNVIRSCSHCMKQYAKVREWSFPPFEEFYNNLTKSRDFYCIDKVRGKYRLTVGIYCYHLNSNDVDLRGSIASNYYPSANNVYADRVVDTQSIRVDLSDKESIKKWYESSIKTINKQWARHIADNYLI